MMAVEKMETVLLVWKITDNEYENICNIAEDLKGGSPLIIQETEIYFNVSAGRLWMKTYPNNSVRVVRDGDGIHRSMNFASTRNYVATIFQAMLKKYVGYRGIIAKLCKRYMIGQTRIHIDKIADLGIFVKIAVICDPDQSREEGEDIARAYQQKLGIKDEQRINYTSYIDLLAPRNP